MITLMLSGTFMRVTFASGPANSSSHRSEPAGFGPFAAADALPEVDGAEVDGAVVDGAVVDGAVDEGAGVDVVDGAGVDGAWVDGGVTALLVRVPLAASYFMVAYD
jgi:hypothetical protein